MQAAKDNIRQQHPWPGEVPCCRTVPATTVLLAVLLALLSSFAPPARADELAARDAIAAWAARHTQIPAIRTRWQHENPIDQRGRPETDTVAAWPDGVRETVVTGPASGRQQRGAAFPDPWSPRTESVSVFSIANGVVQLYPAQYMFDQSATRWDIREHGIAFVDRSEWFLARTVADGSIAVREARVVGSEVHADTGAIRFTLAPAGPSDWVLVSCTRTSPTGERTVAYSGWRRVPGPVYWVPASCSIEYSGPDGAITRDTRSHIATVAYPAAPAGMFDIDLRDALTPDRSRGVARDASGSVIATLPGRTRRSSGGLIAAAVGTALLCGCGYWLYARKRRSA